MARGFILEVAEPAALFEDERYNPPFGQLSLRGQIQVALGISQPRVFSEEAAQAQVIKAFRESITVIVQGNGLVRS